MLEIVGRLGGVHCGGRGPPKADKFRCLYVLNQVVRAVTICVREQPGSRLHSRIHLRRGYTHFARRQLARHRHHLPRPLDDEQGDQLLHAQLGPLRSSHTRLVHVGRGRAQL